MIRLPGLRRLRAVQWVVDGSLAFFLGLTGLPGLLQQESGQSWFAFAFAVAGVLLRRAWQWPALGLAVACAIAQMVALVEPGAINLGILMIVYACAAHGSRAIRITALVTSLIGAVVAAIYILWAFDGPPGGAFDVGALLWLSLIIMLAIGSSWLLGLVRMLVLRSRAAQVERQLALAASEHARERAAIEGERARIAREMHDVLAHSLVTIATLSDGAKLSLRSDPDSADEAIGMIGGVSREALGEVRGLLAQLRHEQPEGPASTFDEAPRLIGRFQRAGLRAEWRQLGEPAGLTPGASLAAYRVVQEGLTNALRHGDGASATITAEWSADWLTITIENPLPRPGAETRSANFSSGGYGLAGLGERIRHEHGTIEHGVTGRAFVLRAALPVAPAGQAHAGSPGREGDGVTAREGAPS